MRNYLRIASIILTIISFLLLAWMGISWIDIIIDNCHPNPSHSKFNFFVLLTQKFI